MSPYGYNGHGDGDDVHHDVNGVVEVDVNVVSVGWIEIEIASGESEVTLIVGGSVRK